MQYVVNYYVIEIGNCGRVINLLKECFQPQSLQLRLEVIVVVVFWKVFIHHYFIGIIFWQLIKKVLCFLTLDHVFVVVVVIVAFALAVVKVIFHITVDWAMGCPAHVHVEGRGRVVVVSVFHVSRGVEGLVNERRDWVVDGQHDHRTECRDCTWAVS